MTASGLKGYTLESCPSNRCPRYHQSEHRIHSTNISGHPCPILGWYWFRISPIQSALPGPFWGLALSTPVPLCNLTGAPVQSGKPSSVGELAGTCSSTVNFICGLCLAALGSCLQGWAKHPNYRLTAQISTILLHSSTMHLNLESHVQAAVIPQLVYGTTARFLIR